MIGVDSTLIDNYNSVNTKTDEFFHNYNSLEKTKKTRKACLKKITDTLNQNNNFRTFIDFYGQNFSPSDRDMIVYSDKPVNGIKKYIKNIYDNSKLLKNILHIAKITSGYDIPFDDSPIVECIVTHAIFSFEARMNKLYYIRNLFSHQEFFTQQFNAKIDTVQLELPKYFMKL